MGDTPVLSPALPRIAPPTLHTRTPSRSPTRQRLVDDILSDLTPATTLEAFKSPSGRLKASIELATPSERAFGLRAALASKNIQEWVDELSNWSWPAEGGSLGFEVPPAKRRKLSSPTSDGETKHYEQNGTREASEPEYNGSLLAQEVLRYEVRLDEITADMEELNVEEIKRQVLDTHFSSISRPSSSASNAPMPSSLSSYTKMDDFTAIVTATVLQALPNLSRLMRLMDVWSIRVSVLRKVPPLLVAMEDAEIALKSGWKVINTPGQTSNGGDVALSRETFEVMRDVLQDKVTTLGQDLDYMLDILEGREDTLPESWLDRMESIEQDYGEWVVSGDRKVREGEWAKMAKARKEAEDARRLKEAAAAQAAEEAEMARRKAQKEAEEALAAEMAKRKAEQEAEEAEIARRQALKDAEDARNEEIARQRAQDEAEEARAAETAKRKAEQEAQEAEMARLQALKDTEDARNAEMARQKAQKEAEVAAAETARRQAEKDVEDAARARQQAKKDAEDVESARLQSLKDDEETEKARHRALQYAEDAEFARKKAQKQAEDAELAEKQAEEAELARQQAEKDAKFSEIARLQALKVSEEAEEKSRQAQKELEDAKATETALRHATEDAKDGVAQRESDLARSSDLPDIQEPNGADMELAVGFTAGDNLATYTLKKLDIVQDAPAKFSKFAPFDGNDSEESEPPLHTSVDIPGAQYVADQQVFEKHADQFTSETASLASTIHFDAPEQHAASIPGTPKVALSPTTDPEDAGSPRSPKIPRFGHAFANFIRRASTPKAAGQERPRSANSSTRRRPMETQDGMALRELGSVSPHSPQTLTRAALSQLEQEVTNLGRSNDTEWIVVDSLEDTAAEDFPVQPLQSSDPETNHISRTDSSRSNRHSRNISVAPGCSTPDPASENYEAGLAEYFAPVLSPVQTGRSPVEISGRTTPSKSPLFLSAPMSVPEPLPVLDGNESPIQFPSVTPVPEYLQNGSSPGHEEMLAQSSEKSGGADACEACDEATREIQGTEIELPALTPKASIAHINSGIRQILIPSTSRESMSSDTPTIVAGRAGDVPSSPISPRSPLEPFPETDESPSAGRIGLRNGTSYDYSPPDSPPPIPAISKRPSLHLQQSQTFSSADPTAPLTPLEPPLLDDVDVSPAPFSSPKKASSDEQLQQQISTLLESIPARIRLTSEPDPGPFSPNTLHPKKTRRSITPSFRSSSSMSNYSTNSYTRAPTPSFTLAPAFSKTSHRSRTPGNPEIKLYHLSRSTGEAPIKLFVRLVGEHGERVMVRVGGGWADLGEYLKEYASHHGRRTAADNDRVEIQDLPPRIVSNGSTISSSATLRGTGSDSPVSRPHSVLERPIDRPGSSLNIRKTRKSIGESESTARASDIRSPSTPLPNTNRRSYETPPSAAGSEASSSGTGPSHRSSSRLSWTDEDSSLGLAGPKSKKVAISEKDQEWVESMKEKVRLASAEKERRNREREAASQRRTSFGEMEKAGGTKRLFRKSGV